MPSADIAAQIDAAVRTAGVIAPEVKPGITDPSITPKNVSKKGVKSEPAVPQKPSKLAAELAAEQKAASDRWDKAAAKQLDEPAPKAKPDKVVEAQLAADDEPEPEPEVVEAQPEKAKASATTAESEEKALQARAGLRLDGFDTEMLEGMSDAQIQRLWDKRSPVHKDVSTKLEELARLKSGQAATEQQPGKGTPATPSQALDAKAMAKQFRDSILNDDEGGLEKAVSELASGHQRAIAAAVEAERARFAPIAGAVNKLWTDATRARLARVYPELEEDDKWNAIVEKCGTRVREKKIVINDYQDVDGLYSDQVAITYGSRAKTNAVKAAAREARNKGQMAPSSRAERETEKTQHDVFGELLAARERGDDEEIARLQKIARSNRR